MILRPLAAVLVTFAAPAFAGPLPVALGLDRFYAQYRDAGGIPIVGSDKVPSKALDTAKGLVEQMLANRPDLARWLVANGYRVALMAENEATTDLPEQAHWTRPDRNDPRLTRCERKHYDTRIGFREAKFTPEGFYLNGKHLKLRGLNRHQTYPFVGQAMPARVQRRGHAGSRAAS